jgi:hypothetical protein
MDTSLICLAYWGSKAPGLYLQQDNLLFLEGLTFCDRCFFFFYLRLHDLSQKEKKIALLICLWDVIYEM